MVNLNEFTFAEPAKWDGGIITVQTVTRFLGIFERISRKGFYTVESYDEIKQKIFEVHNERAN